MAKKQYSMVIDLHRCVGCSACDIACKSENNVHHSFAWSNHIIETQGVFPDTKHRYIPTLCNHCSDAPCVTNCPTKAMYKTDEGITMLDEDKCIGCRACQVACPYNVIYFNTRKPHQDLTCDRTPLIAGATSSGSELIEKGAVPIPHFVPENAEGPHELRPQGVVEKCTFCHHRLARGELPACVEACPADARIFGDINDPQSAPRKALAKNSPRVLKPEKGTRPNVFYIRDF